MYRVTATVMSIKGTCTYHKVGDQVIFDGQRVQGTVCGTALAGMMPFLYAMRFGAEFPWMVDNAISYACPDPNNPVVFEIKREPDPR